MAKLSDNEVYQMLTDFSDFKTKAEPYLDKVDRLETAVGNLQTANEVAKASEDSRMRKAVIAVHKSGSFRIQQWAIILVAIATIAGIIFNNLKPEVDYQKMAEAVVKASKP
jgi:t-SNARE complex subunit (syntaxin)